MIAGLTGGIGSGKSIVARLFELMACPVFYSDDVARELYFDKEIKPQVLALLGAEAYISESEINKTFISNKIFGSKQHLDGLNAIIHPAVRKKFEDFAARYPGQLVVKESALLFEAALTSGCDKIIVVAADEELRIRRVMARDHLSREQILQKMEAQLPQEHKIKNADYVIINNDSQLLIPQVVAIVKKISSSAR